MTDAITCLSDSTRRLTALLGPLSDEEIAQPAFPSEWSIADVLSHLGSGSVIAGQRLADGLAGTTPPEGFNQRVWAEWDAKTPRSKVDDALPALVSIDRALAAVSEQDRARFSVAFGPLQLDWEMFVGALLSERSLHEWDVAVTLDGGATLAPAAVELLLDRLPWMIRFAAKPAGRSRTISVVTTEPDRRYEIAVSGDGVAFLPAEPPGTPAPPGLQAEVSMPAEALVRLVSGRLDPAHTPASVKGGADALDQLRAVFPGF